VDRARGGDTELTLPEQTHYIGHLDALKAAMSVRETALFWSGYLGGGDIDDALERLDLDDLVDLPVAYLSAGQRRRLALARFFSRRVRSGCSMSRPWRSTGRASRVSSF